MFRKLCLTGAMVFALTLSASAENWIPMGEIEETGAKTQVWMDGDIQPVAKGIPGKTTMIPGAFVSRYKMVINGNEEMTMKMGNIVDFKAAKILPISNPNPKWVSDKEGADGLLFNAYLIKNRTAILDRKPMVIKEKFALKDRTPDWKVDENGWLKAYEQADGSEAWVQTKSAQLSVMEDKDLPQIRMLVRRSEVRGEQKSITYSYEVYDAVKRTRDPLRVWNADQKPLLFKTQYPYPVAILSKDAAIGTVGYSIFVANRPEIEKRGQFKSGDPVPEIPTEWFTFKE